MNQRKKRNKAKKQVCLGAPLLHGWFSRLLCRGWFDSTLESSAYYYYVYYYCCCCCCCCCCCYPFVFVTFKVQGEADQSATGLCFRNLRAS